MQIIISQVGPPFPFQRTPNSTGPWDRCWLSVYECHEAFLLITLSRGSHLHGKRSLHSYECTTRDYIQKDVKSRYKRQRGWKNVLWKIKKHTRRCWREPEHNCQGAKNNPAAILSLWKRKKIPANRPSENFLRTLQCKRRLHFRTSEGLKSPPVKTTGERVWQRKLYWSI